MKGDPPNAAPDNVPAQQVVHNAAQALKQLCKSIAELEDGLVAARVFETATGHGQANPLQKLDMILQMSEEMALLLSRLAEHMPGGDQVAFRPVVTPVRLEQLRAVFDNTSTEGQQAPRDQPAPTVMLF